MDDEPVLVAERGLLAVSDDVWNLAVRRAAVIGPLARADVAGLAAVDAAAAELGVSRRQVYLMLRRWRDGDGVVSVGGQRDFPRDGQNHNYREWLPQGGRADTLAAVSGYQASRDHAERTNDPYRTASVPRRYAAAVRVGLLPKRITAVQRSAGR